MTTREAIKAQIDVLPEDAIDKLAKFLLGLYRDDTEYLSSIPGMAESIKAAAAEPLSEGVRASKVNFNV